MNDFPTNAAADSAYVRIHGGFAPSQWTPKRRPSFQVVVRAALGSKAEEVANAVYDAIHQAGNFAIGSQHITGVFADQSAPLYLGLDENNRVMYSVNFTAVLLTDK